jgi:hypothetical protein
VHLWESRADDTDLHLAYIPSTRRGRHLSIRLRQALVARGRKLGRDGKSLGLGAP